MLDQYRSDFAEFHTTCAREHYLFHSGQKHDLEIARIYDRYAHLFERSSIERLKHELENTSTDFDLTTVSIRRLLAVAVEQFLEDSVKRLTEEISTYEANATLEWGGSEMTFQDATVAITIERNRERRSGIYARRLAVVEASNGLRAERLIKLHETSRSLGYPTYLNLFENLRRLNYSDLALQASSFVARTESVYLTRLDDLLRRDLGVTIDEAERSDAMCLSHLTRFDERFPSRQMLRVYRETMAGLGIRTDAQSNISIDSEPRRRKNPRAFCMPISIPDEVKLVIRPAGGQSDYQALLHESGHAQHYGWASGALPSEFKYTGDYALTETYAFLFNHLISDGDWLAAFLGFAENAEFVRAAMLARLVSIRRYSAKLMYEIELHKDDDLAKSARVYAELQTSATCFKTEPTEFLFDLDDSFYSASYLRAWAFEISLREHLKTRFGIRWWASQRAGGFLKELWETGDRYTADEMAAQIGIGPIAFDPLIDEFNQALK
ncbi:MAG TPA: hypothetical protein VLM38_00505 [Blastocatellia bacterium]|nr:hypothetical protein [Blastocatellia bacterium]